MTERIEAMLRVMRIVGIWTSFDRLVEGLADNFLFNGSWLAIAVLCLRRRAYQAVQLVVGLDEIDAFAVVAREIHRLGPAVRESAVAIYRDEAMRGFDLVPEKIALCSVCGVPTSMPEEAVPDRI